MVDEERSIIFELVVAPDDLGKVIGRDGRTARAPHAAFGGVRENRSARRPRDPRRRRLMRRGRPRAALTRANRTTSSPSVTRSEPVASRGRCACSSITPSPRPSWRCAP
ncbi:MAG: hypothetical protein R3A78_01920 [Polyangiales bacterium]